MRDPNIWDDHGSVIVRTLFKRYQARLAKCGYFEKLFAAGGSTEMIDGCPGYCVPRALAHKEFRDLLTALEPLYVLVPFSSRVLATRHS